MHHDERPTDPDTPRILVLRRHNHIGDMLCSLPLYAAMRKRWPDAKIDLLATPTRYPVPLQALNPFVDRITYYRKRSFLDVLRAHRALRAEAYDMAVVPSTVALSRTSHITAFLTGAPVRVGVSSIDGENNAWGSLLTVKEAMQWNSDRVHQEQRNRAIAELAGCPISDGEVRALRVPVDAVAERIAAEVLGEFADGRPLVGLHPGAGKPRNVWPAGRFAALLAASDLPVGAGVLVTAGLLDEKEAGELSALLGEKRIEHRILRNLDIAVLAAIFRRLAVYLTNDTGTMHIAGYSGCPTLSLFGPTQAWEWAPRGPWHRALQSPDGTMEGITVDEAAQALSEIAAF